MLQAWEWISVGALGSIALFFLIFYLAKPSEIYNLLFVLGCLVAMIRIVFFAHVAMLTSEDEQFRLVASVNYLSFIWGPYLYAMLADRLFPSVSIRLVRRIFYTVVLVISALIVFVPGGVMYYGKAFDYIILAFMLYAMYLYVRALLRRLPIIVPVFIGNLVFVAGIGHDVLMGSHWIRGLRFEVFQYAFFLYALIMASVLAHRYMQADKKRLEAQLKFLHAQIQPHFLYNTLGTISAYCKTEPETANELLEYLSTYLRGKLRTQNDQFVCLNDEIDLVKAYLTIEHARFGDRITVAYDIDEDCSHALVPSLILQPLVENAVKHGLLPRKEGGKIWISVHRQSASVAITVGDNGVGMDNKTYADILEGKGKGIGIGNTNERLRRYYGAKLAIRSAPGKGCEVTMLIPGTGGENP